jgi:hypothetical protein
MVDLKRYSFAGRLLQNNYKQSSKLAESQNSPTTVKHHMRLKADQSIIKDDGWLPLLREILLRCIGPQIFNQIYKRYTTYYITISIEDAQSITHFGECSTTSARA